MIKWIHFPIILCCCIFASILEAKEKWIRADSSEFEAYSNISEKQTSAILGNLSDAKSIFHALFPSLARYHRIPLKVLICKNQKTFEEFFPYLSKSAGGVFLQSSDGPVIVLRYDANRSVQQIAYHEYVHYLLRENDLALPLWLNEGLAEVFSTVHTWQDGRIQVGKAVDGAVNYLKHFNQMPMEKFFQINRSSPEYQDSTVRTGTFYTQAWALTHYLLFGDHKLPPNAFYALMQRSLEKPIIEESDTQEILGLDFRQLSNAIRIYCRSGEYTARNYDPIPKSKESSLVFSKPGQAEVDRIKGLCLTGDDNYHNEAMELFLGSSTADSESSDTYAYMAMGNLRLGHLEEAIPLFELALEKKDISPYTRIRYVNARLALLLENKLVAPGAVDRQTTGELLTQLFAARKDGGAFEDSLYEAIGRAWLSSVATPSQEQIAIMHEGRTVYPHNPTIAYLLAFYHYQTEEYSAAVDLINSFAEKSMPEELRTEYNSLREAISEKQS